MHTIMRSLLLEKEYKHGVFCHANGTLVYPVGGQYVRFEAEVGIDDTSSGGSVFFQALNTVPTFVAEELNNKYPEEIGMLGAVLDGLDTWLITRMPQSKSRLRIMRSPD